MKTLRMNCFTALLFGLLAIPLPAQQRNCTVKVISNPAGAAIWLDGKDTKLATPDILEDIVPGNHIISLQYDGYCEYRETILLLPDVRNVVRCTLTPVFPSASADMWPSKRTCDLTAEGRCADDHAYVDLGLTVKWAHVAWWRSIDRAWKLPPVFFALIPIKPRILSSALLNAPSFELTNSVLRARSTTGYIRFSLICTGWMSASRLQGMK